MSEVLSPHLARIVVDNYFVGLHFRAFIDTGTDEPAVLFSLNDVSNAAKVDFVSVSGGALKNDGRKGIFVYMRWTQAFDLGDTVTITMWQRGAERYGDPEVLPEDGFDSEKPTAAFVCGG